MRVLTVSFSIRGRRLQEELEEKWRGLEPETEFVSLVKCRSLPALSSRESLEGLMEKWFRQVDALVFIGAAGIAVRAIAPFLVHKSVDPAVLVVDETGKFCISLLSGHAGGANRLAEQTAALLGVVPVITTATDRESCFAVDVFAEKNGLLLEDWQLAKEISVRLLEGGRAGMKSEFPVLGEKPEELQIFGEKPGELRENDAELGILISRRRNPGSPFARTLLLVPATVTAGVGCRKGTPEEVIDAAISACLEEHDISPKALAAVASIDLKAREEGLLSCCGKRGIPLRTYPAGRLAEVKGSLSSSDFVRRVTGVDNVCERSALADTEGSLICGRKVYGGVTVALAERKRSISF